MIAGSTKWGVIDGKNRGQFAAELKMIASGIK